MGHETLGFVEDVVVDEGCRGKGVGKALMDRIMAEARKLGCEAVSLHSGEQRVGAHEFYRGLGFREGRAFTMKL
jgi:GNAT superfamily N-acetyltransferase